MRRATIQELFNLLEEAKCDKQKVLRTLNGRRALLEREGLSQEANLIRVTYLGLKRLDPKRMAHSQK